MAKDRLELSSFPYFVKRQHSPQDFILSNKKSQKYGDEDGPDLVESLIAQILADAEISENNTEIRVLNKEIQDLEFKLALARARTNDLVRRNTQLRTNPSARRISFSRFPDFYHQSLSHIPDLTK